MRKCKHIYIEMILLHKLHMSNLTNNHINILDLPDEILFIIIRKLNMADVLSSLVRVENNERLNEIKINIFFCFFLIKGDLILHDLLIN